ncbi:MAG: SpoIIE family protein phosphatase [Acidobacteriota bacterium]
MADVLHDVLHEQLTSRRLQLQVALERPQAPAELRGLLGEVDAALDRMSHGVYGLCESCGDAIEGDRLLADPVLRFCLDHLTTAQQEALQRDLELAARVQRGLLPASSLQVPGWSFAYEYHPAGIVSGDYCDVLPCSSGDAYFLLGDIAGKGVAASMQMTQLHAMFRSLIPIGLALSDLVERVSAIFCDSKLPSHYATLACTRATSAGDVEICNAGHLPVLLVRPEGVTRLESNSLPIGMFCTTSYVTNRATLRSGDTLVFFTDGLSEAENADGGEFGVERIEELCSALAASDPAAMARSLAESSRRFSLGTAQPDDVTILAVRRA